MRKKTGGNAPELLLLLPMAHGHHTTAERSLPHARGDTGVRQHLLLLYASPALLLRCLQQLLLLLCATAALYPNKAAYISAPALEHHLLAPSIQSVLYNTVREVRAHRVSNPPKAP